MKIFEKLFMVDGFFSDMFLLKVLIVGMFFDNWREL